MSLKQYYSGFKIIAFFCFFFVLALKYEERSSETTLRWGVGADANLGQKVPSSFNFIIPCCLFNIQNNFTSIPRPEA